MIIYTNKLYTYMLYPHHVFDMYILVAINLSICIIKGLIKWCGDV